MDLKQLEYFVRVAELGSFTRAAMALDVAQPALSRQVRLLEVELRQNLLVRNGRGATPTEAGKLLLEHGRGILHQVERAREELGRVRGALAGRVAIGLPPSLARVLTVPLTRAFRLQLPQASISISEGLSVTMQEWLTTGRLDIAVLYNAQPAPEIEITPLQDEELLLVQPRPPGLPEDPPPGPIALRDVAALPLVIPSRPNALRMHVETEMANIGCRPIVALEIDGVSAILDLVIDGAGAALLSRNAVASSIRPSAYQTRPVCEPALRTRLYLATSSLRPATLTQQTTLALIGRTLAAVNAA
ncbi:MAG: LysR substrate-binding domain-containing protein [Hydrogenophaga sp.]|jgi:LysR family nitrogen assimilation transcriptional regulator|uniref:LysR substrate-binding domain-containing protein n=1 Tax=Hydrogenophaga sp. TaxID=1904254 RepID=UPI00271CBBDD|nr:LysR substrate-binding domain-containing protein [Hydrogenophaga sp.]MDO9572036.1 LysR substrate-binding domain-containing protein [Hydrogenophaga sp.]MDP2096914.1 LysR substrate-binding domain-containing protein [Hydrogenophaga sp.]MDP2221392.1 LysR substrate-binding domain-containing protein [Hydrogenophaga sp.]MDP3346795.1 LysR substrate-binding domain-containing protein [Hydrogenophaga sp.]MDP3808627.1 LysR substrate-binding domain-containing protein [Hydrogenophaga sp.]